MKYIYCLTLAIWNCPHNAMSIYIVFSGQTTISDMPENPMVDANIMNLLLFCPRLYQLIVCSCINEGHHGFCRHLSNIKWPAHFSENPLFEEYMYQNLCFYHKLTYYGFG